MSDAHFVLAAQLSTIHSPADALETGRVLRALEQALHQVSLDILILGVEEVPDLFRMLTSAQTRPVEQVFLWYPLLSDYPGLEPAHLTVDYKGALSQGWPAATGAEEIRESFRFACPCNPAVLETTLGSLERILETYDFTGVFLDKFRFASPANGFDEMLSCFCPHCRRAASARGLDLAEIQALLNSPPVSWPRSRHPGEFPGAHWLSDLLAEQPALQQFVQFRADVITKITRAVHDLTQRLGRELALDTFTPGLAPLVGQDYQAIAPYAAWIKPMIYRLAQGPASLRLEVPCLADGLTQFLGREPLDALGWAQAHVPELRGTDFDTIRNTHVPLNLVAAETRQTVALVAPVPVYVGVETVSLPEFNLRVSPKQVEEAVQTAHDAGASGVVASWDLLHTPLENLRALNAGRRHRDMDTSLLQVVALSKSFPGVKALDSVDFDVRPGEIHALVGENGAGKSTLIKILSGALHPDQGRILLAGQVVVLDDPRATLQRGIATISQELMLVPQLSVAENILLGRLPAGHLDRVEWKQARSEAQAALAVLGVRLDPDALVAALSVAQQQATEIARALSRQAKIIIMDEPTSALAGQEVDHLLSTMERLRSQGASVIFVTHKLDEVFRVADRITVLRDGRKIDTVIAAHSSTDSIVSMMVGRSLEGMFTRQAPTIGPVVLEVNNLTREGAFYEVSFALHAGEILGLAGLLGAGRTDLARAIFGVERADSGEIRINGAHIRATSPEQMIKAGVGLAPEDRKRDGLVLGMSVGDNLTLAALRQLARWGLRRRSAERAAAATQFTDLSVQAPSLATEVLTLSGGNQQKVVIGKWLATFPRILILDEPTRGIDVGAKAEVHALMQRLAKQGVSILMISSELLEIMSVCDRTLVMHQGRVTGEFVYGDATQEQIMACATGQTTNMGKELGAS